MSIVNGEPIKMVNGALKVPSNPIIPFIEGDGIGVDITPVMRENKVFCVNTLGSSEEELANVFAGVG